MAISSLNDASTSTTDRRPRTTDVAEKGDGAA
jgi:hypothetical protein